MIIDADNHTLAALVAHDTGRFGAEPHLPSVAAERARLVALDTLRHGHGDWSLDPESRTGRIERLLDAYDRAHATTVEPAVTGWRRVASWVIGSAWIVATLIGVYALAVTVWDGATVDDLGPVTITNASGREVTCEAAAQGESITLVCPFGADLRRQP